MHKFTRRSLPALALAAAACANSETPAAAPAESLNALARAKGMRFGTAMGSGGGSDEFGDPRYLQIVRAECGVIVSENEHKWAAIQPAEGRFNFGPADAMVAWANANGISYRGHTLVWHHSQWLPQWINNYQFGARPAAEAEALLRAHIGAVAGRYRFTSWDVINETVDAGTGALRDTTFTRALGHEASNDLIFHIAREHLPDTQLVYNDYMSWEGHSATHRAGVLRLLEGFKVRGVPVDALGVQGHIGSENSDGSTGFASQQEREWRAFLDEVTGMGYQLLITELDVHDKGLPADAAGRDATMASYLRGYLDLMFSYTQLRDVLVWGLTDNYSWLQERWLRPDRLPKRPNLYGADYQPKPMREAVAAAFRAAPAR